MPRTPWLIDLHCDWLLQYAPETTVFDPALYADVSGRLGQAEGYLTGTSAAVLACFRRADDWSRQADPWAALDALVTRIEAEFPGRLLTGADDLAAWRDDRDGLCWALIGVEGFDALVRGPADLERLPALFDRGVRVFQMAYTATGRLAGSSEPGDDRGLTDLGRDFLHALLALEPPHGSAGSHPILDLAHLNPVAMGEVLAWFESDASRAERLLPVSSHGAPRHAGFDRPRALTFENLARLRALGGTVGFSVGPPFFDSPDSLRRSLEDAAALPWRGRPGFEGIAIGTDFLGVDRTLPELSTVEAVVTWLTAEFDPPSAGALISGNALALIERMCGVATASPGVAPTPA